MKHLGTQLLETERLILRKFTQNDAEAIYNNWASDSEVTKFLTWPTHTSSEVSRRLLNESLKDYEKMDNYQWAVVLKENGNEPIGCIGVTSYDEETGKVEVGYCIGRKWWHKGIASETLKCIIDFLFDKVGAEVIEARHDSRNPHSGEVMKKCGMKYEGTLKDAEHNNQWVGDSVIYSIVSPKKANPDVIEIYRNMKINKCETIPTEIDYSQSEDELLSHVDDIIKFMELGMNEMATVEVALLKSAFDFIDFAKEGLEVDLTFSEDCIKDLDDILENLHEFVLQGEMDQAEFEQFTRPASAYLGIIILKNVGGTWIDTNIGVGIQINDKNFYVYNVVARRVADGDEEDIMSFYKSVKNQSSDKQ